MDFFFEKLEKNYRKPVIDIYNYFIENSFAAYPQQEVDYSYFDTFLSMANGYPAIVLKNNENNIIGFAFLHAYHQCSAFARTAEITYFILPEFTGKGLGAKTLKYLINEAKKMNIQFILASISSLNEQSIHFHKNNGFQQCGCFKKIGCKNGEDFDIIWMQKYL